jgi:hypothetical protein
MSRNSLNLQTYTKNRDFLSMPPLSCTRKVNFVCASIPSYTENSDFMGMTHATGAQR